MKRLLVAGLVLGLVVFLGWVLVGRGEGKMLNPLGGPRVEPEKPYERYSFERLAERGGILSPIEVVDDKFYYRSEGRRISGQIKMPEGAGPFPTIVMARGYVEKEEYTTGVGTKNAAEYYRSRGYLTLAPDFSGYGESDSEDTDALGARLVKPVEILDLLASLPTLLEADTDRIYLWGHSNGGQVMLSVAEILGYRARESGSQRAKIRGVTLWAPVSKPFPYNILYYTDEADDRGKWLRSEVARFEAEYDVDNYSIDRYWDWLTMPVAIHQGTADESVPLKWSDELNKVLTELGKDVTYHRYSGADHNMRPVWNSVVARDLQFFDLFTAIPQ